MTYEQGMYDCFIGTQNWSCDVKQDQNNALTNQWAKYARFEVRCSNVHSMFDCIDKYFFQKGYMSTRTLSIKSIIFELKALF